MSENAEREMMKIKAVIFDLDGTLYNQNLLRLFIIASFFLNLIIKPRKTFTAMKVLDGFRKAHEELRELKEVKFNIADEQIRMTVEKTGMPEEKVNDIINDRFYNFPLKFLRICKKKHIEETIDVLKSEGYKIGLLSDYYTELKLEKMGLQNYFPIKMYSVSKDINSLKPNPDGLLKIAEKMQVKPGECIYVGDREYIDGKAAVAAGMIPVILHSNNSSYRSFKNYKNLVEVIKGIDIA